MKNNINHYANRLSALFCAIFGHHYAVSKIITSHIKEYQCVHCNKEVTTDASGNLSELTPKHQDINNTLQHIYQKRHRADQQVA